MAKAKTPETAGNGSKKFNAMGDPDSAWIAMDYDDGAWDKSAGAGSLAQVGRYVCRASFELSAEVSRSADAMGFGPVDDADSTYCNGVPIGQTGFETPRYGQSGTATPSPRSFSGPDVTYSPSSPITTTT